ncbi:MAG TPA: thiol reductant ABC exporter subunit CydD [Candidatus Nanopelagicales bacterium]|nr:thiol reductant ABC exporter subunit CydD [Candidatus Nanopelagicales bacterium]
MASPERRRPGAVDPRLWQHSRGVRQLLAGSTALAAVTAVLVVVQAFTLADAITAVFQRGSDLAAIGPALGVLSAVVLGRAAVAWAGDVLAQRAASRTSAELRTALLEHVVRLGPGWLAGQRRARIATLATRGGDAIEPYVSRYLPQLLVAVVVPLIVGVAILTQDVLAAVIVAVTVPLIPVFMVLVGMYTRRATDRQWRTLALLSGHFLDVITGLATLKAFGRQTAQAGQIAAVDTRYRRATLGVLRVSFLSSLVLELVATLSVAVVAVAVGLRLLAGTMDLRVGLVVLILAPEVYLPIRAVGQQFHAAADGVSAAAEMFDVMATQPPPVGTAPVPTGEIALDAISYRYPARTVPAPPPTSSPPPGGDHAGAESSPRAGEAVGPVSLRLRAGQVTALVGPSGCGKSTLLAVLLGFLTPDSGRVTVGGVPLAELDPDQWRRQLAWVGQDPVLLGPTLADDVRLGTDAPDEAVAAALRSAGLEPAELAAGLHTPVGDLASAVSAGQRRRIALARVLLRPARLVLLDEPSAGLDAAAEDAVLATARRLADGGSAVLLVAHRPALVAGADVVVDLAVPAGVGS